MKKPITNSEVLKALDKICLSTTFVKSPRSVRILRYLVEQSLGNNPIKEHVIGLELFKFKYNSPKNDSKVRVYIFNLRKKLKDYYDTEGKSDDVVFEIEKGQYKVSFKYRKDLELNTSGKFLSSSAVSVPIIGVVLLLLFLYLRFDRKDPNTYCWEPFLTGDAETVCLISDHKVVSGKLPDGSMGFIRNPRINREKELVQMLQEQKGLDYQVTDFSFLTKMAPVSIQYLTEWFLSARKEFEILIEREFSFEVLHDKNLIFIGQSKTMGKSSSLLLKNSRYFSISGDSIVYKNKNDKHKYGSSINNNQRVDYTIVSFMPLDNNRECLMFSSNHDIGVIASIKNFTNQEWLNEFYSGLPEDIKYYHALFKVTGLGRTELGFELEQIEIMNAE